MPLMTSVREQLEALIQILNECEQGSLTAVVLAALAGTDETLNAFLVSNELWGGAGSIADQGGMKDGKRTEKTRRLETILIRLGKEQMRTGKVNVRTAGWVSTYESWAQSGI